MLVGLSDYVGVHGARRREEKPSPAERVKSIKLEMQKRSITADEIAAEMYESAAQVTNSLRDAARPERLDEIEAALLVAKSRKPAPRNIATKEQEDPYDPRKWGGLIAQAGFPSLLQFCERYRMQRSTLANIISGGSRPSPETRRKFIDALEGRREAEDIFNLEGRAPKNAPAVVDKEYPPSCWRQKVLAAGYQSFNQFCQCHKISASAFNRISGGWSTGSQDSHDKIIAALKDAEKRKAEGLI
jgi:hypothetical protein